MVEIFAKHVLDKFGSEDGRGRTSAYKDCTRVVHFSWISAFEETGRVLTVARRAERNCSIFL